MDRKKVLKINSFVAIFVGMFSVGFVFFHLMFPSFSFFMNKKSKDFIKVQKQVIDNHQFVSVYPFNNYIFGQVELNLQTKKSSLSQKNNFQIKIFKGFDFQFYDLAEEKIDSMKKLETFLFFGKKKQEEIVNGKLISSDGGVAFVSQGRLHFFISPEIFEKMGFDWKNVEEINSSTIEGMEVGEKINFSNISHLDGTFILSESKVYMIWEKKLWEVSDLITADYIKEHFPLVKISEIKPVLLGNCQAKINEDGEINCLARINYAKSLPGPFFFEITEIGVDDIEEAKITLKTRRDFNWKNIKDAFQKMIGNILVSILKDR